MYLWITIFVGSNCEPDEDELIEVEKSGKATTSSSALPSLIQNELGVIETDQENEEDLSEDERDLVRLDSIPINSDETSLEACSVRYKKLPSSQQTGILSDFSFA